MMNNSRENAIASCTIAGLDTEKQLPVRVLQVRWLAHNLCVIETERPSQFKFTAGQFARIGVAVNHSNNTQNLAGNDDHTAVAQTWLTRALSVVSSPYAETLTFLISIIPHGGFSEHIKNVQVGDVLALEKVAYGFLTLARFQSPKPKDLWLLATGTGVAPFLSMLQDFATWQQYEHITLAYSVRHAAELAFIDELQTWQQQFNEQQLTENQLTQDQLAQDQVHFTFLPIITRTNDADYQHDAFAIHNIGAKTPHLLHQRLPLLIASGELEALAGRVFNAQTSHILLCGNPQMVEDTRNALKDKGLTMNRRGEGNIAVENYW